MSRSFFLGFVFLLTCMSDALAQTTTRNPKPTATIIPPGSRKNFAESISITDVNGRPFQNVNTDVEGSPYLIDDFRFAKLTLNLGSIYETIRLKLDICNQEAHVLTGADQEIIADKGMIRLMTLTDSVDNEVVYYKFQTGYPAIDKNTVYNYYQVLSDGKLQLLKSIRKEIVETKDVLGGEKHKSYVQYENYFVFQNNEINNLKKDKDFVLPLMKDHETEITEWLKKNKTNFRNISSLTRLFDYYNSL